MTEKTRCGFVTILGAPNVGKSTLVNQLVGTKISIVSPKVQTTRQRILGIVAHEKSQLILVDTPGIFAPKKRLERAMVHAAWEASRDSDILVVMVDVTEKSLAKAKLILDNLANRPVILVLNKIDLVKREVLLDITEKLQKYENVTDVFMISALTNDGVADLMATLAQRVPLSPWLYPEDQLSNMPQRLWAAEITREQLYLQLHQELPYETWVETEGWEQFDNGSIKISQIIYVARDGQKGIILGKKGERIKAISAAARLEMATHLDSPVHLFLFVKVSQDWLNKREAYKQMGLDFDA